MRHFWTRTPVADRKPESQRERRAFDRVRRAETEYGRRLRALARQIGELVSGVYDPEQARNQDQADRIQEILERYAATIRPWAATQAARMLTDVSRRDEEVWTQIGRDMGRALRTEIKEAPTGEIMRELMLGQVGLITSLPLDAGQRVHDLTQEAIVDGTRAKEIAAEIMKTGDVTQSRATLIARTEVARTSSALVEARAKYVGSDGYVWRTAEDSDVRKEHKALAGKFVRWDSPPVAGSRGERAHAGCIYNCRCYPEPVFPEFRAEAA